MRTLAVLAASLFVAVVLLVFLYEPAPRARPVAAREPTAAPRREEAPPTPPEPYALNGAQVVGTVMGREGPMLGARVVARTRTGDVVVAKQTELDEESAECAVRHHAAPLRWPSTPIR